MKNRPRTSKGLSTLIDRWDGLDVLERRNLILDNRGLFVSMGLLSDDEADHFAQSSESGFEYMAEAHPTVLSKKLNINATVQAQEHRKDFKTVLQAVFL